MSGIMTLPAFIFVAVTSALISWYTRDLCEAWTRWRENARQWARTVGDPDVPVYPDLAVKTWVSPGHLADDAPPLTPRRVRVPGTALPQRVPGAALLFEPAPAPLAIDWLSADAPGRPVPRTPAEAVSRKARHGDPRGYWAQDVPPLQDTQLMPAVVDDETRLLPATTTEQFYALTRANWPTQERAALLSDSEWQCAHCVVNEHRDCPGCACPCGVEAYVSEVRRG